MSNLNSVARRAAVLFAIATVGIACVGTVVLLNKASSHSHAALQHRVDLLEQDVGYLQERVVKLEDVLVAVLSAQTASSAKVAEAKSATAATKPAEELPVSVAELPVSTPPAPPAPARPVKRKPATRHQVPQESDYPQMKPPYPWAAWENYERAQQ